ncbi:MAG: aminodeoxychorismate/anthranilate synthase component II [Planctomycetaceae bacterium]
MRATDMILLIDNYDSFVYNLARYFVELGCETEVLRNDARDVSAIRSRRPEAIVLSPGPCTPCESGVCLDVVRELASEFPILGVCLGHQAVAHALGANIIRAAEPMHGRTSLVRHQGSALFVDLPDPLSVARYHSLVVEERSLPPELAVTARTADGVVMAIQHQRWPLFGVQFHPESVLTTGGHMLLGNFLQVAGIAYRVPADRDFREAQPQDDFFSQDALRDYPHPRSDELKRSPQHP